MSPEVDTKERRVLLLTPTGKDSALIFRLLIRGGNLVTICRDARQLCEEIAAGAALVIVAEEGLSDEAVRELSRMLGNQPTWSDLPIILLTMTGKTTRRSANLAKALDGRANLTFLERPLRMLTLASAVEAARRARVRQYEMRSLLERAADEVDKRDQFIAMLGHELRNPLAAILAASEIINRFGRATPALVPEQCAVITRQTQHMTRLVDDLLDVARLTSGRVTLEKTGTDLREIVERSVQTIRITLTSEAHCVELRLPGHPVMIHGDAMRLEQVFGNLLSNAVRYSPLGGTINVSLESRDETAIVRVKDEGEGIDPALLPASFEPFVQAGQPLARNRGGLGLGLSVVRNLVELHAGTVSAESDGHGAGSEFTVCLPRLDRAAGTVSSVALTPEQPTAAKRVLIVEDNADARRALSRLLKLLNQEVFEAEEGVSGLDQLLSIRPDLAIIDIGLPNLSGYEVASKAREHLGNRTRLIAVSGYSQSEDQQRALAAGFDDHLAKPLDFDQVSRLLGDGL
jgi:signal transduction histidine kinase